MGGYFLGYAIFDRFFFFFFFLGGGVSVFKIRRFVIFLIYSLIKCSILLFMQAVSLNQLRYYINSTSWLLIFINITGIFWGYWDIDWYFFGYAKNRWYFFGLHVLEKSRSEVSLCSR